MMNKALCAVLLLAAVDAAAALSFRVQSSDSPGARVLADGPRMRMEFDNGMVLITDDDGKTLTLLDPSDKTFVSVDVAGVRDLAATNVKSSARDLGDGGAMEGFPTHKWVVESAFDLAIEPDDPKGIMHAEMTSESWRTERIPAGPVAVAMEQMSRTGVMTLDKLFGPAPGTDVKGFPIKIVTTRRMGRRGGKVLTKTITIEAKEIRTDAPAASPAQFAIPAGYTKSEE